LTFSNGRKGTSHSRQNSDSQENPKPKTRPRSNTCPDPRYRRRQNLVEEVHKEVRELVGERLAKEGVYLRGEKVLFVPAKSPNSLKKIVDFLKAIMEHPRVKILKASFPFSRKNEWQLKGFLNYLELETKEQVEVVQKEIYNTDAFRDSFQKCVPAVFDKPHYSAIVHSVVDNALLANTQKERSLKQPKDKDNEEETDAGNESGKEKDEKPEKKDEDEALNISFSTLSLDIEKGGRNSSHGKVVESPRSENESESDEQDNSPAFEQPQLGIEDILNTKPTEEVKNPDVDVNFSKENSI